MNEHDYSCLARQIEASTGINSGTTIVERELGESVRCLSDNFSKKLSTDLTGPPEEQLPSTSFTTRNANAEENAVCVKLENDVESDDLGLNCNENNRQFSSSNYGLHRFFDGSNDHRAKNCNASDGLHGVKNEKCNVDDIREYYFESDHLALRGNPDYLAMLKTMAVLEAQRMKAIQDLDRLLEAQETALGNPIEFVEKLQRKENLHLPGQQNIVSLPVINWDAYLMNFNPAALSHKHMTRRKHNPDPPKPLSFDGSLLKPTPEGRSETYNQPWTSEEQKRLEELLVKFPPEEIESRRWEKIAQALGNRTRQQVASRVQKYFIKLTKAGLPVPGRPPNVYVKKSYYRHHHHRHNRFLFQPSTFFASYDPPVTMCENEDDTMSSCNVSTTSSIDGETMNVDSCKALSDDESIPVELRNTDEYKELLTLQKLRMEKEKQASGLAQHVGFKCDRCDCEPILGTRWHCLDCPQTLSVDFCEDCVDCMHETETHNSSHQLQPINTVSQKPYIDRDYTTFLPGDYNYLDPNYMPAT